MTTHHSPSAIYKRAARRSRRGLAPIELAMWIPSLLLIAALMLNFGVAVTWRVRGEIVSRDTAWRARWSRDPGQDAPLRPTWPVSAKHSVAEAQPILQLDDPALLHPVARGPLPNGFVVRETLDPARGMLQGNAAIDRDYPLAPKLGPYRSGQIPNQVLDQLWPCRELGTPNVARRTKVLYQLPTTDPSLPQAFVNADIAILSIPHFAALSVLDQDEEVRKYRGYYADFHPRARMLCEVDVAVIERDSVNPLVISTNPQGQRQLGDVCLIPRRMTAFYLSMYNAEIARLEAEMAANPMLTGVNQAAIDQLQPKVQQLEEFQARIPPWEQQVLAQ